MAKVIISPEYCKGCMLCVSVCPIKALRESGRLSDSGADVVEFDPDAVCTACTMCALMCPDAAIEIVEDENDKSEARSSKSETSPKSERGKRPGHGS
jgi:2-oxoglutarate ferredoxin oxidoreductase subunit delta